MGSASQRMGTTCGRTLELPLSRPQGSARPHGDQPGKAQRTSLSRMCTQEFLMFQKK